MQSNEMLHISNFLPFTLGREMSVLSTQSLWQSRKIKTQSIKLQVAVRRQESQLSLKSGYKKQTLHCKSTVNNKHYEPDLIQICTNHRTQILL